MGLAVTARARRTPVLACTAVAVLSLVAADTGPAPASASSRPAAVLGIVGSQLVELHPLSLRPVSSRRVVLGTHVGAWTRSPSGVRLAIASTKGGALRLVDLGRLRRTADIGLGLEEGGRSAVAALAWPTPRHLFAVVTACCPAAVTLVGVDPELGHVVTRVRLEGALPEVGAPSVAATRAGVAVLLAPLSGRGAARLVTVDGEGQVRSVTLERITVSAADERQSLTRRTPALAVSPSGERAVVLGGAEPLAHVDLRDLHVSYHALAGERGDPGRGAVRQAAWISSQVIAVSGSDESEAANAEGEPYRVSVPAGLRLVDATRWRARRVDPYASAFSLTARTVLAYAISTGAPHGAAVRGRGIGLRAYGPDGRRRFQLHGTRPITWVGTAGPYAYVQLFARPWTSITDVRTGRIVRGAVARLPGKLLVGAGIER